MNTPSAALPPDERLDFSPADPSFTGAFWVVVEELLLMVAIDDVLTIYELVGVIDTVLFTTCVADNVVEIVDATVVEETTLELLLTDSEVDFVETVENVGAIDKVNVDRGEFIAADEEDTTEDNEEDDVGDMETVVVG